MDKLSRAVVSLRVSGSPSHSKRFFSQRDIKKNEKRCEGEIYHFFDKQARKRHLRQSFVSDSNHDNRDYPYGTSEYLSDGIDGCGRNFTSSICLYLLEPKARSLDPNSYMSSASFCEECFIVSIQLEGHTVCNPRIRQKQEEARRKVGHDSVDQESYHFSRNFSQKHS